MFAACGIEGRFLLWAAVGETLRLGLPLVPLTVGSFARDPKVYNVGHSFSRFPPCAFGTTRPPSEPSVDYI